ncbi:type II toxin-antitoxin system HipA family toxin [Cysteiniphilum halobium]|uniref:type II toxin-antitoxin system HipA family toxin n=1 Tax=Cysteiniphilum halobium TaxID=2219059 RepID=UPI003F863490
MREFIAKKTLEVFRSITSGQKIKVGQLAQNQSGIYFQYDQEYLANHANLSPFTLKFNLDLQKAPSIPHNGLHGVFADSLPDGWGMLLMDRVFRQQNILPHQLTPLDRLAFVGDGAIGALSFVPGSEYQLEAKRGRIDIYELGHQAQRLFEGSLDEILPELVNVGSSGGARPKAQIYVSEDSSLISTKASPDLVPYIVKFTSQSLPLGHEEGLCEAAYLKMAKNAGLNVPDFQVLRVTGLMQGQAWIALKRFDIADQNRFHVHSLCGLIDADFRVPSVDYEDLIKLTQTLCHSPQAAQLQFRRAMFNLFALNQDDHTKNWAFILNAHNEWSPSPFYDVTFSPNAYNEHMMAFQGYGRKPPLKTMQSLAYVANYASWQDAQKDIQSVVDALSYWQDYACDLGVNKQTVQIIQKRLDAVYAENRQLLG